MNDEKVYLLVDPDTGEIVQEVASGSKIVPKRLVDRLNEELPDDKIYINLSRRFVRLHEDIAAELAKLRLTGCEQSVMLWLGSHARTGSGAVLHGNNKRITREAAIAALGFGKTAVYAAFARLLEEEIIGVQTSCDSPATHKYYFNPYVLMRGRYVSKDLYRRFKDTKWAQLVINRQ